MRKKLTFMMIPDTSGTSREVQFPVWLIYGVVLFLALLAITTVFFAAKYFSGRVDSAQLASLQTENSELQQKYEEVRWDLEEVGNRYDRLVEKEIALRTIFELPEISNEERQLGIGGPIPQAVLNMSEVQQKAYTTEVEVDRLLRLSRFEIEKFDEVEKEMTSIRDRLDHTPSIWPTKGWNSRGYGMKYDPFTGSKQFHRGIDVANKTGTPIIATASGRIKKAKTMGGLGKTVVIDHGYGFVSRYGHMSKLSVKRGSRVKRGDIIGYMGSTGYSTGPHLHYEVWRSGKPLNPRRYILNTK